MVMLDLQAFQERKFEVRLIDGTEIKLRKPTQKLVIDIMAYEQNLKGKKPLEVIDAFVGLMVDILNNNTEGRKFNKTYVEKYFSLDVGKVFLEAYIDFVQEIQADPN